MTLGSDSIDLPMSSPEWYFEIARVSARISCMSTVTFDTQELVRELRTSGMPQEQAEAVVRTIVSAHSELATRRDLETMELRLTIKLGAFLTIAVGIIIAFMRISL